MIKRFRYHIAIFFSVIGPGFITAVVDNDAGGILTYSQAGAKYGYQGNGGWSTNNQTTFYLNANSTAAGKHNQKTLFIPLLL